MNRILRGAKSRVEIQLYDPSGNPSGAGGPVTADVMDSAGQAVLSGQATTQTGGSTGPYGFDVTPTILDVYTVTWNLPSGQSRTSEYEVVGTHLFTIADLRAFDSQLANLEAATAREVREAVEERFERAAKVSFTLRGRRAYLDGRGTPELILPDFEVRKIVAIKVNGTALSASKLAEMKLDPCGYLVWGGGTFPEGFRNVEVLYEHGFETVPRPVHRAALRYAKHLLIATQIEHNERATGVATDVGFFRLTLAGRDGPTGLPEVDAVLDQFGRRHVGGFG